MNSDQKYQDKISIVIPAYNEADGITHSIYTISDIVRACTPHWEIIIVDDGSSDAMFTQVFKLSSNNSHIKALRFSRNFGKEAAILAGLQRASGDAVITIDADLQHPPRLIPEMIEMWRAGAQVVDAVKRNRDQDSMLTKIRAKVFNTLLSLTSRIDIHNSSDFKLLDRVVVNAIIRELPERGRFYRGLVNWVGYDHKTILFDTESRVKGKGKWSVWGLIGLAIDAIVSFTSAPLRIVTILGFATLIFGFFIVTDAFWSWLQGESISGFATIIITELLIGSFIMISLGIIGEYIAKIYDEIKARPTYLVADSVGFDSEDDTSKHVDKQICSSCGQPINPAN